MPYCPECRDEFQDWLKVCPDCKVALVGELPIQLKHEKVDEPLVHIAIAPNESVANMWSGIFRGTWHSLIIEKCEPSSSHVCFYL